MRGARIAVRDWQIWCGYSSGGDPRGTAPLVYVPGGPGMPHHSFLPIARFAPPHRVQIFYDPTGSGSSDRPVGVTWDLELFVDEVAALVRELGLARFHLLGSSFGGTVCMALALRRPPGLLSMTLVGATASYPATRAAVRRRIESLPPPLRDALLPTAPGPWNLSAQSPAYARAYHEYGARFICRIGFPPALSGAARLANSAAMVEMKGRGLMYDGTLRELDLSARLGEITTPTQLFYGAHDALYPEVAEDVHRGIAGSRMVVFHESAHVPQFEEPGPFARALHTYLDDLDGPRD